MVAYYGYKQLIVKFRTPHTEKIPGLCRSHCIVKGKFRSRTGHEGPEGEKRYSSTLSLTSVLDGSGC
jgi:hypothetical protein